MAKVCKFCSLENDDKEEFCTKCGAKLPSFRQYEAGLMDEMGSPKKPLIKINFAKSFQFTIIAALIIAAIHFFRPSVNEQLPKYDNYCIKFNTFELFIKNQNETTSDFDSTINTDQHVLSLYLTSAINPAAADPKKITPYMLPRIIVKTPSDNINSMTLVKHSKFYGIHVRLELNFKQKESVWHLESWKFCNFPTMSVAKQSIWEKALQEFKNNDKLKKILGRKISIQRSKLYMTIIIKQQNATSKKAVSNINSFFSRILQPIQGITQKRTEIDSK